MRLPKENRIFTIIIVVFVSSYYLYDAYDIIVITLTSSSLHNALSHHGISNLHEAGYVSTLHVVDVTISLSTILNAVLVNVVHDALQVVVNFLRSPAQTL